jgi:prevent-host-death family protein
MRTMQATEFRARCSKVIDEVRVRREPIIITKRGKPVTKLVPVGRSNDGVFGCLKGVMEIVGDIESPAVPPEDWEANRRFLRRRQHAPQPSKLASCKRERKSTRGE